MPLPVTPSAKPKDNLPLWAAGAVAVLGAVGTLTAGWPWYAVLGLVAVLVIGGVLVQGGVTPNHVADAAVDSALGSDSAYQGAEPAVPVPPHPAAVPEAAEDTPKKKGKK